MRIHLLQHVHFEGLASIAPVFEADGCLLTKSCLYNDEPLPSLDQFDMLIVMGGPMSIHDEQEYPWLVDEKAFILSAIEQDKTVLGICLGAQLIASVLGATISRNPKKEIGWFPVTRNSNSNREWHKIFPEKLNAFHWHGETFSLPKNAELIYSSEACENQGFIFGHKVVALQFHMETTAESAMALIKHCAEELVEGRYIQTKEALLRADGSEYSAINSVMEKLIEKLIGIGKQIG